MKKVLIAAALASSFSIGAFAATDPILNGSFEQSNVAAGLYKYSSDIPSSDLPNFAGNVSAAPWNFFGGSGVAAADVSGYNNPWGSTASAGANFAFLQNIGSVSQSFSSAVNSTFSVNFDLAQRTNSGGSQQTVSVTLDGHSIWSGTASAGWSGISTQALTLGAGTHTLEFSGTNFYQLADTTAFIDNVKLSAVSAVPEPETYAMLLAGLGLIGAAVKRRKAKQA